MKTTDYSNHMEYVAISVSRQQSLDAIYIYLIFITRYAHSSEQVHLQPSLWNIKSFSYVA